MRHESIVAALLTSFALGACGRDDHAEVKRSPVGQNWSIEYSTRSGSEFVSITQDEMIPYGSDNMDMQSFVLLCDSNGKALKAMLLPIKRMYENRNDEVSVEIAADGGSHTAARRMEQRWTNANSGDANMKYLFAWG